jgi:hypothetical protein
MKLLFIGLLVASALAVYLSPSMVDSNKELAHTVSEASDDLANIDLSSSSDSLDISKVDPKESVTGSQAVNQQSADQTAAYNENQYEGFSESTSAITNEEKSTATLELEEIGEVAEASNEKLPGEDVNFDLKLYSSTHHLIDGRATSDIGHMLFKCRLMPSNEVKLTIKLKQGELDDIELLAYVDLANFTMELDGANSILNKDHKQVLKLASLHLRARFEQQYKGLDVPEHALVLIQMIGYWSVSPKGYVHEKRSVVSD